MRDIVLIPSILILFCMVCGLRAQYELVKAARWQDPNTLTVASGRLGLAGGIYLLLLFMVNATPLLPLREDLLHWWTLSRSDAQAILLLVAASITIILCRRALIRSYMRRIEHVASR